MYVEIHLSEDDKGQLEIKEGLEGDRTIEFCGTDVRIVLPGSGMSAASCARKIGLNLLKLSGELQRQEETDPTE